MADIHLSEHASYFLKLAEIDRRPVSNSHSSLLTLIKHFVNKKLSYNSVQQVDTLDW